MGGVQGSRGRVGVTVEACFVGFRGGVFGGLGWKFRGVEAVKSRGEAERRRRTHGLWGGG